jgi:dTDP-4-dehydrorhamnose reductase
MAINPASTKLPRVLVLGGTGMLGHKLVQKLAERDFQIATTARSALLLNSPSARASTAKADEIFEGVDVLDEDQLSDVLDAARPDVVVNAVGVIKQIDAAKDPVVTIAANALLPHRLASLCDKRGARLIHVSTDCVFSGRKGPYSEQSPPDAEDLYGRSKLLGEPGGSHCLTLRTSIVGRGLKSGAGLIDWFVTQRGGKARGYARALYSGLSTLALADLIGRLIVEHPKLGGLWHVASEPISKYELLALVDRVYSLGISLERDEAVNIDRRLDGSRFRAMTGCSAPSWDTMIAEMRADPTPYS